MLYQTLPLLFQLNPSSSPSPFHSQENQSPLPQRMDIFVEEKALKTSFWPEKTTPQVFCEDVWVGNGGNGMSGDDLFVDGLLDFSNDDDDDDENVLVQECEEEEEVEKDEFFSEQNSSSSVEELSVKDELGSVSVTPPSELSVPVDELANLEWLSHFVEDSFSEFSLQHFLPEKPKLQVSKQQQQQQQNQHRSEPKEENRSILKTTGFLSSVPAKARSKRSRTGGRVWSMGSLPLTDSSSSSSSSSSTTTTTSCLIFNRTGGGGGADMDLVSYLGKPPKKPKKRPGLCTGSEGQRRCSHCGVQKTPQWRTGPMGAKTLCNACGVRFKSGRLLPEYRPACSPTFSSEVHSNNHRKVLEMRRKKETIMVVAQHEPSVQSF